MINNDPVTSALASAGRKLRIAKDGLDDAKDDAKAAAKLAIKSGESEVYVAQMLGVNRLTIRSWMGK